MVAFTVTAQDLSNFANYCDQQVQDIQSLVLTLHQQVEELCSAPYVGPASSQLMVDVTEVAAEANKMSTVMADVTMNLRHNAQVYIDGETQNVSNLQAATAGINFGNNAAR
jgi:uncharacterized protein YukE